MRSILAYSKSRFQAASRNSLGFSSLTFAPVDVPTNAFRQAFAIRLGENQHPAMQVAVVRVSRVKGLSTRGWRRGRPRKSFASRGLIIFTLRTCSTCTFCRVKGFASRCCRGRTRVDVLRLPIAFREGQWVLHR